MENSRINHSRKVVEYIAWFIVVGLVIYVISSFSMVWALWYGGTGIIFGAICSSMANSRGRWSPNGFIAGFFFGFLSVMYYLIVGDTIEHRVRKEEEAREKYHASRGYSS